MKSFDFSFLGGFPLDQDVLDFLQSSYKEIVDGFAKIGLQNAPATNTPILVSGGCFNAAGNSISNGWVWYNGELYALTGGSFAINNIPNLRVTINTVSTSFTFDDASSHAVKFDKTAIIDDTGSAYSTFDATHFPFQSLQPVGMARNYTGIPITSVGAGSASGTVWYKINNLTHQLLIHGQLTLATPGFLSNPPSFATITTIPIPAQYDLLGNQQVFSAIIDPSSGTYPLFQATGGSYMNSISALVDNTGNLKFEFIKAGGSTGLGITDYIVSFNATINLKLK